jgi:hypothetical protein
VLKQQAQARMTIHPESSRPYSNSLPGSCARLKNIARFFHQEGSVLKFFIRTDAD